MNRMIATKTTLNAAVTGGPLIYTGSTWQCSGAAKYQSIYEFGPSYPLAANGALFEPVNGMWAPPTQVSTGELENTIDEASTRCQSERGRPPENYWETIAERKQTYALLASYLETAKQITKGMYLDVLNRRRDAPFRKFAKAANLVTAGAAGAWLITRYGLLPLIKDIQSLRTQLSKSLDQAERHTARGKAVTGRSVITSLTQNLGHVTQVGSIISTDEVFVRAMSLDEWRLTLADHFGLGTKDLVTLPLDLLTLSFVADWFVNLGDFVGAIVPLPGVNQLGSCIVVNRVTSLTCTVGDYSPSGIASIVSKASLSKTGVHTETIRFPGLRAPTFVKLNRSKIDPGLDSNVMRIVDASALVAQRLTAVSNYLLRQSFIKR